jgi:hypothetical protein
MRIHDLVIRSMRDFHDLALARTRSGLSEEEREVGSKAHGGSGSGGKVVIRAAHQATMLCVFPIPVGRG